jgi:hypothetical protein
MLPVGARVGGVSALMFYGFAQSGSSTTWRINFLDRPGRTQTERAQSLPIRRHLGIRAFDRHARPIFGIGCAKVPWKAEPPPN